ncbi:MAG: CDP-alcohol phosphatidyltransferase family protein [Gemmatimonadetes bacterium]|nr:CDP-alcohol phosphatidyltransferase family protein [Gemmatimonadota bacterium]MBT8405345.1 CDP-alcohol phosphatidyltransferase family protein [Gemmatimonadota bacterium]NNK64247.1 CDP-alcohol phosphatidyltransferase family protein [Gemmatimonadota bacterium]
MNSSATSPSPNRVQAWIPNLLTGIRLLLVPVFVVVAWDRAEAGVAAGWVSPTFWLVVVAGASDLLDGYLARRWGATSRVGALLDAVADKSLQFTALVTITLLGRPLFTQLPLWLVVAVFLRDFVLLAGWILLRRLERPVSFEHEIHGRVATTLVLGLVLAATLGVAEGILLPASALAAAASLLSAGAYIRRAFRPA